MNNATTNRKEPRNRVGSGELVRMLRAENRAMRDILLRIHSARIAMSESGVIEGLDDIDRFFREPNCN